MKAETEHSSYGDPSQLPAIYPLVTPDMLRSRAAELALSAGRSSLEIKQSDYEQAKRELTGETDFNRQQTVLSAGR